MGQFCLWLEINLSEHKKSNYFWPFFVIFGQILDQNHDFRVTSRDRIIKNFFVKDAKLDLESNQGALKARKISRF